MARRPKIRKVSKVSERNRAARFSDQLFIWRYCENHWWQMSEGFEFRGLVPPDKRAAAHNLTLYSRNHWHVFSITYLKDGNGRLYREFSYHRTTQQITGAHDGVAFLMKKALDAGESGVNPKHIYGRAMVFAPWTKKYPSLVPLLNRKKDQLRLFASDIEAMAEYETEENSARMQRVALPPRKPDPLLDQQIAALLKLGDHHERIGSRSGNCEGIVEPSADDSAEGTGQEQCHVSDGYAEGSGTGSGSSSEPVSTESAPGCAPQHGDGEECSSGGLEGDVQPAALEQDGAPEGHPERDLGSDTLKEEAVRLDRQVTFFKALSHPMRLTILKAMPQDEFMGISDIHAACEELVDLKIKRKDVSAALRQLHSDNLLDKEGEGATLAYRSKTAGFTAARSVIEQVTS